MNPPVDQLNRDLGRMEGKVDRMEGDLDDVRRMVADMHKTISEARGGWKTLIAVGSLSAAVTTAFLKGVAWLKGGV